MVLINGFDAWVRTPKGTFALTSHFYAPEVIHPDGASRIKAFKNDLWPTWTYHLEDGTKIEQEILVEHGRPIVAVSWRLLNKKKGVSLKVRPLLSGRDYHGLHRENPSFRFDADKSKKMVKWRPYNGVPGITVSSNGKYIHQPDWYRNFLYKAEKERGLDFVEDLASPGSFEWDLSRADAVWIAASDDHDGAAPLDGPAEKYLKNLRKTEERRRGKFKTPLYRAADNHIVRRGKGKTIVAGYPWFTDWGRDTFVAFRGLCLATGRIDDAKAILLQWAKAASEGMLPNRFTDRGKMPEYNSVDAPLWFIVAVRELSAAIDRENGDTAWRRTKARRTLRETIDAILMSYTAGARYGIRCDTDGLLAAGEPGVPLTWMDAKVGPWVVTPRFGKPVEIQALWVNALYIGGCFSRKWKKLYEDALESFQSRFWHKEGGYLYDAVDVNHRPGTADASFRPNQILAVGGLPTILLDKKKARRVVESVEKRLWTPAGLRSLARDEPQYSPRYEGSIWERDRAYHQGTAWPWLMGPFIEAWVWIHGNTTQAKKKARKRFFTPFLQHLDPSGSGYLPEIADGDPPHTPRGCPSQAWSVGEALRVDQLVLGGKQKGK
jgi:predicted glycogen debranching enzyme